MRRLLIWLDRRIDARIAARLEAERLRDGEDMMRLVGRRMSTQAIVDDAARDIQAVTAVRGGNWMGA